MPTAAACLGRVSLGRLGGPAAARLLFFLVADLDFPGSHRRQRRHDAVPDEELKLTA